MRKFLLILSLVISVVTSFGQNLSVTSFSLSETDQTANTAGTIVIDQNGNKCALVKVKTTQTGFNFDAGMLRVVKTEQRIGEIWVYVPQGVKRLTISHQKLGTIRDYDLGLSLQAARTYILTLAAANVKTIIEQPVTMQYIVFKVTPSDAFVILEGPGLEKTVLQPTDGTVSKYLNFGTYKYTVQAADYHAQSGNVRIADPVNKHILSVELKPAFGYLAVPDTGTLSGATVCIDEKTIGTTPISSYRLPSGSHSIMVNRTKYKPITSDVTIEDGKTSTFTQQPLPNFTSVTLIGVDDSEIWINDTLAGQSPWTGELEYGPYKVECRKQNHHASYTSFDFIPGFAAEVTIDAPMPICGALNIDSTPAIASVYLDGKPNGETPISIGNLLVGTHEIHLSKAGYADLVRKVTIVEGKTETVTAELLPAVPVRLSTTAKNPAITLGGQTITSLSDVTSLAIGDHTISISEPDCSPFTKTFTVTKDGNDTFVFDTFLDMTITVNGVSFKMVAVQGGIFEMGSEKYSNERPIHSVTLDPFRIGETEVTQELWQAVMGTNPSHNRGSDLQCPVEEVSWNDCQSFILKLNQLTGKKFRLPTEAEWEFAARGGNKSKGYKYSGGDGLDSVAWYGGNSDGFSHAVKTKSPNELGVYDMSGNVWEWCGDWYGTYRPGSVTNPKGLPTGEYRVIRGGSCYGPERCRISDRLNDAQSHRSFDQGFRLAL